MLANIFVVHTPFQVLIVKHMVNTMHEFKDVVNILFVDMYLDEFPESNHWTAVVKIEPVGGTILGSRHRCYSALKTFHTIFEKYNNINLFLSDIEWPLNNALYGNYVLRESNINYYNFPDGIANLYMIYPDIKQKLKNYFKALLGLLGGFPYSYISGDKIGLLKAHRVYSLFPDLIINECKPEQIVEIPILKPENRSQWNSNICVFLGQPIHLFIPYDEYRKLANDAADFVARLGYKQLYYKPHPRENNNIVLNCFLEKGFELFDNNKTIEELILTNSLECECLISYTSSALIHIKLFFPYLRCIAFQPKLMLKYINTTKQSKDMLFVLLGMCGVEIYADN